MEARICPPARRPSSSTGRRRTATRPGRSGSFLTSTPPSSRGRFSAGLLAAALVVIAWRVRDPLGRRALFRGRPAALLADLPSLVRALGPAVRRRAPQRGVSLALRTAVPISYALAYPAAGVLAPRSSYAVEYVAVRRAARGALAGAAPADRPSERTDRPGPPHRSLSRRGRLCRNGLPRLPVPGERGAHGAGGARGGARRFRLGARARPRRRTHRCGSPRGRAGDPLRPATEREPCGSATESTRCFPGTCGSSRRRPAPEGFLARRDADWKEYLYRWSRAAVIPPRDSPFVAPIAGAPTPMPWRGRRATLAGTAGTSRRVRRARLRGGESQVAASISCASRNRATRSGRCSAATPSCAAWSGRSAACSRTSGAGSAPPDRHRGAPRDGRPGPPRAEGAGVRADARARRTRVGGAPDPLRGRAGRGCRMSREDRGEHGAGEEQRVDPVVEAAVARQEGPRVLDARPALPQRLDEVPDLAGGGGGGARERTESGADLRQDHPRSSGRADQGRTDETPDGPLPGLVGRDCGRELVASDGPARVVRERITAPDDQEEEQHRARRDGAQEAHRRRRQRDRERRRRPSRSSRRARRGGRRPEKSGDRRQEERDEKRRDGDGGPEGRPGPRRRDIARAAPRTRAGASPAEASPTVFETGKPAFSASR